MTDREKELISEFMAGLSQVHSAIQELAQSNSTATIGAAYTYARQASRLLAAMLGEEHTEDCK